MPGTLPAGRHSNLTKERAEVNGDGKKLNTHELRSPELSQAVPASILLADDSEGIRLLISEILSEAGYEVTTVSNGDEALDAARRRTPDVVITDLNMPGPPLSEIIRELRRDHPGIRIVILSGLMDDLMSQVIVATGVDAAIDKSMAPELLVDTVRRLLSTQPSVYQAPLPVNHASLPGARR